MWCYKVCSCTQVLLKLYIHVATFRACIGKRKCLRLHALFCCSCAELLAALPDPCSICLLMATIDISVCLADPASRYERTYGLMLLSTKELINPLVQGQNNQSQRRGLITASVSIQLLLSLSHIYC